MKRIFILGISLLTCSSLFGQSKISCSSLKAHTFQAKAQTPTLTDAQQAEENQYDVHFYRLNLNMTNQSTSISGNGTIQGKTVVATDSILFELFKTFTVDSIYFNGINTPFTRQQSLIRVPVNLPANADFSIVIFYGGTPPTASTNPLGGAGMGNDTDNQFGNRVTWSLSEPFSAYEWFPVKQILGDKADSSAVNITVDNSLKAGSNGVLDSISDNGNGTSTYHWFSRHPIAYYLISVAVSDYAEYDNYAFAGTPQQILIQNYVYPSSLSYYQTNIDRVPGFIELYSNLFGMYPFADEKYGHCLAPINGGMEHQTMTTQFYFEPSMTAHELAHQWFGDMVTCDTWANIWLNEGFASYAETLMLEYLVSPAQAFSDMTSRHSNIMSQPVGSVWVADSTDEGAIFDSRLVYNKGGAIIHTLRYIINDDSLFFHGLRNYLQTYKFKTATALDFKNVMEQTTGINLDDFFDQWYFGQGYPKYTVKWNTNGTDLQMKITHTTSSAATPTFTNPIDLLISRNSLPDTTIRVEITSNEVNIDISNFGDIKNILQIDPKNWVINRVGGIQRDTNLVLSTEKLQAENVKIYPVPTTDFLTIEGIENSPYIVDLYDLEGHHIDHFNFTGKTQISTEKYQQGGYILMITDQKNRSTVHRFVRL